jgi:hypothetical protein
MNRTPIILCVLASLLFGYWLSFGQGISLEPTLTPQAQSVTPRYQLVPSHEWIVSDQRSVPVTYKIDTMTGDTWSVNFEMGKGYVWTKIKDPTP